MINTGADTQTDNFAQSGENGKLDKTHHHAVGGIELLISIIYCITQEKREETDKHAEKEKRIVFFHLSRCYF